MSESAWKRNRRLSHARGVKKATESAARFGTSNPAANYKTAIDRILAADERYNMTDTPNTCSVCSEIVDDNVIRHGYIGANDSHRVVRIGDRP